MGKYITQELLKTGKHTVTALTRPGSKTKPPEGIRVVQVDYNNEPTIVDALKGQQYLVITLSVMAPPGTQSKLIQAAAKAGIAYVMPNYYGIDPKNDALLEDFLGNNKSVVQALAEIEATGVSSWTALACGLWYEYSLTMGPEWFGFDFKERKLSFFDDGNTKVNLTTWEQCGRAVAALLSLKELPEDKDDKSLTLTTFRNKPLYISSFFISQKDMYESWKRVSGDKDEDWTHEYEPSTERYRKGIDQGDMNGFVRARFVRVFFRNGDGDYESKYGLANGILGLPQEDLDERTKVAKGMVDSRYSDTIRKAFSLP